MAEKQKADGMMKPCAISFPLLFILVHENETDCKENVMAIQHPHILWLLSCFAHLHSKKCVQCWGKLFVKSLDSQNQIFLFSKTWPGADCNKGNMKKWSGQLPRRNYKNPSYSTKVFLGGVPWDITEGEYSYALLFW